VGFLKGAGVCRCQLIGEQIGAYGSYCSIWFFVWGFASLLSSVTRLPGRSQRPLTEGAAQQAAAVVCCGILCQFIAAACGTWCHCICSSEVDWVMHCVVDC
jgi:hypothetical protein